MLDSLRLSNGLFAKVSRFVLICSALAVAVQAGRVVGQDAAAQSAYRRLAPGVMTVIPPQLEAEETFSGPRPMVELLESSPDLKWDPKTLAPSETLYQMAQDVVYRRTIWGLEFSFKPMRIIEAPVRTPNGNITTQSVHYLVYYVKNTGGQLQPSRDENKTYNIEQADGTLRFFPTFVLKTHDTDSEASLDQVLPEAVEMIRRREDPRRKLYDSVSISSLAIPVSTEFEDNSVWGVATWTNIDPHSDFFSVFIQGLTNAYRWEDKDGGYRAGEPPMTGREFTYKTLQLNFWRPGDSVENREDEIRFGVPNPNQVPPSKRGDDILQRYGLQERVDYLWVYR